MHKYKIQIALVLLVGLCACKPEKTEGGDSQDGVKLELEFPRGEIFGWNAQVKALVNGVACEVKVKDGQPYVIAEPAEDGRYELTFPAEAYSRARSYFVLPPAQFPDGKAASAQFHPHIGYAEISGESGKVQMQALCALLKVSVKDSAPVVSVYASSEGSALSGSFKLGRGDKSLSVLASAPALDFAVLNTAGSGGGLDASDFFIAVPAGKYDSGIEVRVTDSAHHACSVNTGAVTLNAGEVKDLIADFGTVGDILFEEHFDNCVWGGDIVAGTGGYGPSAGEENPCSASAKGREVAYIPKSAGAPGTPFFELDDYNNPPAASQSLKVSRELLANMGILDWNRLYYLRAYRGYIGCDASLGYANRPIAYLPTMPFRPVKAEVSLRICTEQGCQSDFDIFAYNCQLHALSLDGVEIDVSPATSTVISGELKYRTKVTITKEMIGDGKWHSLVYTYGAFGSNDNIRIVPTVIRNAKNCFYLDDVVVRKAPSEGNSYLASSTLVRPTTEKGKPGEDISKLRLQPSYCTSIDNETTYKIAPSCHMDWMCGGIAMDESDWEAQIARAISYRAKYGDDAKIWCSHLPYGPRGTERNRDLCVPDEDLRRQTVAFYKRAIRAIAPMKPANVLVHCNQTLLFNDGSTVESMVKSLAEIAPSADSIGAHLVVENMSYGVGADVDVLSDAIDRANALVHLDHEIRICMDTGHANLYLNTVGNRGNVVDWLRAAGTRIGHLHIDGNRGLKNVVKTNSIRAYDDHLFPGYEGFMPDRFDQIGRNDLWGEFYKVLLETCLYRGPFNYELSSYDEFGKVNGDPRYDHTCTPWSVIDNYDDYVYTEFRKYIGK